MKTTDGTDLKLHLGAGHKKYPGYVNVDSATACTPDVVWDLEKTPWPWEDNSVSEIKLEHVLEHLGETTASYIAIWKEMYRVCRNGAEIHIMVPHWTHENFYNDPTHLRAVTPASIQLFDQSRNLETIARGQRGTTLGLFHEIDIELLDTDVEYFYTGQIADEYKAGRLTLQQIEHLRDHQNNISNEVRMIARVVKPGRGVEWLSKQVRL